MELLKKLKAQGWYLTEDGLKKIQATITATNANTSTTDEKKIIATAMDVDFREIAGGALPAKRDDTIPGRIVLQVQKIRNISAPKANEDSKAAPRFLQLELSDGQNTLQALEMEPVAALSLNVPPGTKIYFRAERLQLMQGFLILRATDLQVLGGRVEALVEKWELARTMQKYARSGRRMSGASGPPPWIAFGKKTDSLKEGLPNERNFKSLLAATEKDKDNKENEEFNAMRSEAIAEATKAGAKKVFGGGGQQILDHNVKKILEKGYSEEEAKTALRSTNNNLERALYNLKRRQDYKRNDEQSVKSTPVIASAPNKMGRSGPVKESFGKRGMASAKEEASAAKPAGNVSLFDFLTDKLPTTTNATSTTNTSSSTTTMNARPTPTQQSSSTTTGYSNSNANSHTTKFDKSKSELTKSSYQTSNNNNNHGNTNKAQESNSRPKFENNISSSFAANRSTTSSGFSQRGGRDYERSERSRAGDSYNANERVPSSRYSSQRGGGSRGGGGGRGAASSSTYKSNSRNNYEESGNRKYSQREEGSSGQRTSNNSANYNQNSRSNRASHERATPSQNSNDVSTERVTKDAGGGQSGGYNSRQQQRDRGNDRYESYNENKNRYNKRESNNKGSSSSGTNNNATTTTTTTSGSNSNANKNEHTARVNKLVESTTKLKIDNGRADQTGGRNQQQSQYSTSQQPPKAAVVSQQQQQQQYTVVPQSTANAQGVAVVASNQNPNPFAQLPNGFSYDPSKIIGFQNKETNDFAMTLLKSQGLAAAATLTSPQQQQQQQPQSPQMHQVPPPTQPPTHTYVPATSPMQPHSPYATPTFVLPSPQTAALPLTAPPPAQFGMISGDGWLWKIGDLCLAKYWDDGRYYEAEITAVSDTTCVVFFLGYGNHEEVLKSDCLPITDVNNRPINNYNNQPPQQQQVATVQVSPQMQPPNIYQRGGVGGSGSQRYRGERQMYVPPHKREN